MAAGFAAQAFALGLGEPNVTSVLGQPLQMTVPLMMDAGTELPQECVRIVPVGQVGEPIPSLNVGRISIDAASRRLRIESLQPIDEPTLRVVLEVGCDQRIRREFALLLDPPPVGAALANGAAGGSAWSARSDSSLGLGMAQISAVLGQRLSIKVPVVGTDAGSLTADCVHLADPVSSQGPPVLRQAQIHVVSQGAGAVIEVATVDPVTEPAVRLALDVGCREPLRREYAILLGLPTLAVSSTEATVAAAEPKPPEAAVKPAPKRPTKPRRIASAVPVAPGPGQRNAGERPAEAPAKAAPAPAAGPDRLVLSSPEESARPITPSSGAGTAAPDPNAELLRRLDAMSKRIETLEAELAASREREQETERRAAATREQWTWSMGALGAILLVGAVVMTWRRRRPSPEAAWEPMTTRAPQSPAQPPAPVPVRAAILRSRESPEIGGRATMPAAPTTSSVATEPSLADDHHHQSQITVTELHDTVQVIKELYATVLERNTSGASGASTGAKPTRPLELDLGTPAPASEPAPAERFTELQTEMGLDLDLSSFTMPPAADEPAAVQPPAVAREPAQHAVAEQPAAARGPAVAQEVVIAQGQAGAPSSDASKGSIEFPDEQLTSTPTELSIDIDVGSAIDHPAPITRGAPRLSLPRRPESEQSVNTPSAIEPIDLQLDLDQPDTKARRRAGR